MYYQIDFTNMGRFITPSNYYTTASLVSSFYLRNPLNDSFVTLQNMRIPEGSEPEVVQIWFKELNVCKISF